MARTFPLGVVTLLFALLAAGTSRGQIQAPARPESVPTFASRSSMVMLSATAVDGRGRSVSGLDAEEILVLDQGRPQKISHFVEDATAPARILMLVDVSGSMDGQLRITSARMAAMQFLEGLGPGDQVALAGFDSDYWTIVGWTRDKRRILDAFANLKPFGSTALHDALDRAAGDLAFQAEGRRAVVVITDGVDTASHAAPDDVIARSRVLDVPIYAVSVVSPIDDPRSDAYSGVSEPTAAAAGNAVLERYAALSGGSTFIVSTFGALKKAADAIALDIRQQYRLGYDAPDGPPGFHRVEVRTTRKGVRIRTRSGYMPQS